MTRKEQIAFVRGLSKTVADKIIDAIKSGDIPDNWDGHELRVLLADQHIASASMSLLRRQPRSARAGVYRNFIRCNNKGF